MRRLSKTVNLRTKLLITFLFTALVPFAVLSWISLWKSNQALTAAAFDKLEAVQEDA